MKRFRRILLNGFTLLSLALLAAWACVPRQQPYHFHTATCRYTVRMTRSQVWIDAEREKPRAGP